MKCVGTDTGQGLGAVVAGVGKLSGGGDTIAFLSVVLH